MSAPAFAKGDIYITKKDLAIIGYEPASYFVDAKAKKGKKISHVHAGNTWRFTSAANK